MDPPSYSGNKACDRTRKGPYVGLHVDDRFVFVHPAARSEAEGAPEATVTGCAVLSLTSAKRVDDFTVTLCGTTELKFKGRARERATAIWHELRLPLAVDGDGRVPAGTYALPFKFAIPGTTAPTESSDHGGTTFNITADAGGLAASEVIELCASAADLDPQRELFFDLAVEEISRELGPYRLHCNSNLFVVGGLLSIRLSLASPPQPLTLVSVRASLVQSFLLQSRDGYAERPEPWTGPLAFIDAKHKPDPIRPVLCGASKESEGGALAKLRSGEEWHLIHVARLPLDDKLRASTHADTETGLRISHVLAVELRYFDSRKVLRSLSIKRPVHVNSCCCMVDAIMLPAYSERDPRSSILDECRSTMSCLCGSPLSYLKNVQDPTRDLDARQEVEAVPVKSDEDRLASTASVTL